MMSGRLPRSDFERLTEKQARLHRNLYRHRHRHRLGDGAAMFLPHDQGVEHAVGDFFTPPAAPDPAPTVRLAVVDGGSGAPMQVGNAEKFYAEHAGEVPLIPEVNGRTELPSADGPLPPLNASVKDAVRVGADAVRDTLCVRSVRHAQDRAPVRAAREDVEAHGMPIVIWAYPPGNAVQGAGSQEGLHAADYAATTTAELGADVVKVNTPDPSATAGVPQRYDRHVSSTPRAFVAVLASPAQALVVFSGRAREGDAAALTRTLEAMEGGASGAACGRNVCTGGHDKSLGLAAALRGILARRPTAHEDP